jgi:endonuclease YncB( thermonuclease family)
MCEINKCCLTGFVKLGDGGLSVIFQSCRLHTDCKSARAGEDRYGRTLGYVFVGDVCVNQELLKLGLAWHYKYYNKNPELAKLEEQAKSAKIGLWSQPNPVAPWEFRRK